MPTPTQPPGRGGAPAIDDKNKAYCWQLHQEGYSLGDMVGEIFRKDGGKATKSAIAYIVKSAA